MLRKLAFSILRILGFAIEMKSYSAQGNISAFCSWWPRTASALLVLSVCLGMLLALWPKAQPVPLIDRDGWRNGEQSSQFPLEQASKIDVPEDILSDKRLVLWRLWSPKTGTIVGTIRTVPFALPRFLAVPFYGFPRERPESRIYLRCLDTNALMDVATVRTNNQWAVAYLRIPSNFCSGKAELVATAASQFYVGVGTPFAIDAARFYAHSTVFPKLGIVVATWLVLCSLIFVLGYCASASLNADAPTAGFILVGVAGMLVFIIFHFSPRWGAVIASAIVLASFCAAIAIWLWDRARSLRIARRTAPAALIWLAVSIAYAAYISAIDNGGGSWAVNGLFTPLRWSTDNQIPFQFADALYDGVPRKTIMWGPWLASDRTPLLAALLLIYRATIIPAFASGIGTDFISTAYQLSALTILASWSGGLYYFCLRFGRAHAGYVVFLAFVTSFFLFNTVYVWPKLLGTTYVLAAFGLLLRMREKPKAGPADLTLIALSAALAYLAHASNGLALVPMGIAFSRTILRRGSFEIILASLAALVCAAPWLWWQHFVQPGGDAVIRYALTGDYYSANHRNIPMIDSIRRAYHNLGIGGWIANKRDGLATLLGLRTDWMKFGETAHYSPGANNLGGNRVLDFFLPARSLGIAVVGLVLMMMPARRKWASQRNSISSLAAVIGLASILLTLLVMMPEQITHQQAYGALLLLFLAGALTLSSCGDRVRWGSLVIATGYFLLVWIVHPLVIALRIEGTSLLAACLGAGIVGLLLFSTPQKQSTQPTGWDGRDDACRNGSSRHDGSCATRLASAPLCPDCFVMNSTI